MMTANADDLKDITDFLAQTLPLSALPSSKLVDIARHLAIEYLPKRNSNPIAIDNTIYLVRTGAFEIVDEQGKLIDRLAEGEFFGVSTFLTENNPKHKVYAIEDSLVYRLPHAYFQELLQTEEKVAYFFRKLATYRSSAALYENTQHTINIVPTQSVGSIIESSLVHCQSNETIQNAARLMRDHKVSCLVLIDNNQLSGIVTDRDLRNRVVANGLDIALPISTIATTNPVTIDSHAALLEAQLIMSQTRVHHLPVIEDNEPIGVITATDIVRSHSVSIIHFVDRINRGESPEQVALLQSKVLGLLSHWINVDVSPHEIGEALAVIGDAFVRKAISFGFAQHGDAPMGFAWLAFGSQARKEQSFTSDQDNGLILERTPNSQEAQYFAEFTATVCQHLADFGYTLCPGDIMASNARWRKTVQQWSDSFCHWINKPEPEALLNASIFFDMRVIYGPTEWLTDIQHSVSKCLNNADIFLLHMTKNALRNKPPLGFFRSFIVNNSGEHENELNIKHHGIALINDIARIVALSEQCKDAGTIERIQAVSDKVLSASVKASLREAWLLLNDLKLESQLQQLSHQEPGSNYINPEELSPLRKAHLKNAFKSIENAQKSLALTFIRTPGA